MAAGDTKLPSSWTQRLAQPFSDHRTPLDTIRHHWTQKTFPARAEVRQRRISSHTIPVTLFKGIQRNSKEKVAAVAYVITLVKLLAGSRYSSLRPQVPTRFQQGKV